MDVQSIAVASIALESATLNAMHRPVAEAVQPLPASSSGVTPPANDVTSPLVADIAAPAEIAQLTALLAPQQSPEIASRITALSQDTAAALQVGDHARAMSNISQIAALDPHAVEPLRTDQILEPIRPEVEQVVNRLTTVAKMNAEGWLSQADAVLASPATLNLPTQKVVPVLNADASMGLVANVYGQSSPQTSPALVPSVVQSVIQPSAQPLQMQQSEMPVRISELTRDTALALRQGDQSRAFANVTQIAALDPHAVESLRTDQLFTSMRPELDHLLTRLPVAVKTAPDAPASQPAIAAAPGSPERAPLPSLGIKPETLLHVAHRLFDAGGYANYVRSADLAQSVANPLAYSPFLEQYAAALGPRTLPGSARLEEDELLSKKPKMVGSGKTLTALRASAAPRLQTLWRRAPLLVLLLTWLGGGVIAGCASVVLRAVWPDSWPASLIDFGFNVWATGFLLLVCFGFYARTRNIRTGRANMGQVSLENPARVIDI